MADANLAEGAFHGSDMALDVIRDEFQGIERQARIQAFSFFLQNGQTCFVAWSPPSKREMSRASMAGRFFGATSEVITICL